MNILLSSYSVNPYKGSEDAVGWNWTVTLSHKFPDSKIYLVTKRYNEKDTRKGIKEAGLKNVELIIVDVPDALNWFREKHSAFHHMYYILWQKYAYKWAKKSKIKFDIIHHITMGNYRITGNMYKFNDAYTIFGPVGGGQTTAPSLKSYYNTQKIYEEYRELINKVFDVLPSYKRKIRQFDKIYAVNDETKERMQTASGKAVDKLCDISIADNMKNIDVQHNNNEVVEIIYLGRFIELKGIMLLIDVIKNVKTDKKFHVSLYGSGPLTDDIKTKINEYKLNDKITIRGSIPHTQVSFVYKTADIFMHPTFRDSGGTVFVEAMAHKLPIIALNQSLARDLNEKECGLFVNTNQSKEQIINEFSRKLEKLIEKYDLRIALGENGYNFANQELTLDYKFKKIYTSILQRD